MSTFKAIRQIDNRGRSLPILSTILIIILLALGFWFFRGGSFRLYASLFFGLYYLTKTSWLSIILVSVVQTIAFLPLRIIGQKYDPEIKDFEHELTQTQSDDQYFLLNRKVQQGDPSIVFYILNFVLFVIAFVSAGRVFLLEFYHTQIDPGYLYSFIPYPKYPLQGTIFRFPFFEVTKTISYGWQPVLTFWGSILAFLVLLRLLWWLLRPILTTNQELLKFRIAYNKILILVGGFIGTLFLASIYLSFHFPVAFKPVMLSADISKQNTIFNLVTAIATFLATIHSGWTHHRQASREASLRGIPSHIIDRVFRANMRTTLRNAVLIALFAFWITRLMPCSHDISVLSFELMYVISPFTFDIFLPKTPAKPSTSTGLAATPDSRPPSSS